jgi:hypothetical protein
MGWYQFSPRSCCPVGQSRTWASVRPRAEMGFSAAGPIPPGTPAGIVRVYGNQEYPATHKFKVGNEG